MSSPAVQGVAAVGALIAAVFVGVALVSARGGDVDADDLAMTPAGFARFAALSFGPLGLVAAGAIAVAAVFGDLSLATVGLGPSDVTPTAAATGALLGLCAYGFHHLLKRGLELVGFAFTELFGEMVPDARSGVVYYALGYLVSTSTEEVVFRAALMGAGAAALGVPEWYLLAPSAVVFGIAHTGRGSGSVVSTSAMGVLFGLVFLEFGLVAAALSHAVNNTTTAVWYVWQSSSDAPNADATPD